MYIDQTNITFKRAAKVIRAVNHPLRITILNLLSAQEWTVTTLYVKLRLEQSVASQHLAILREAGLATTRREGKFIFYRTDENALISLANLCNDIHYNVTVKS